MYTYTYANRLDMLKADTIFPQARWSALANYLPHKHKKAHAGQLNRGHHKKQPKTLA